VICPLRHKGRFSVAEVHEKQVTINTKLSNTCRFRLTDVLKMSKTYRFTIEQKCSHVFGQSAGIPAGIMPPVCGQLRNYFDKLAGGVGMRRGLTSGIDINTGDTLDFWQVLLADKKRGRLLLVAEMKLPGEVRLEFRIEGDNSTQTATLRPKGLWTPLLILVAAFSFLHIQRDDHCHYKIKALRSNQNPELLFLTTPNLNYFFKSLISN
jgi:hypothetical protein